VSSGRVKRGDLVALVVFGGGLSWAATLIRI
jgi:3-oxoacyl-[acyl-carrier-protein] synthase III